MRLRIGLILTGCVVVIGIVALFAVKGALNNSDVSRAFNYGQEDITRFLGEHGVKVDVVRSLARNASGTELHVFLFPDQTGQNRVAKITSGEMKVVASPSQRAFIGADGDFVAWLSQDGSKVNFKNGQTIAFAGPFDQFCVDPSGTYFLLNEGPESSWLGRVETPEKRVKIPKSFVGSCVFAKGTVVYISGLAVSRPTPASVTRVPSLLVAEDKGGDIGIISQHDFDWSFGVEDVDTDSDRVLLCTKSDLFSSVYVYDLSTGRKHRVGGRKDFQLFLARNLLTEHYK